MVEVACVESMVIVSVCYVSYSFLFHTVQKLLNFLMNLRNVTTVFKCFSNLLLKANFQNKFHLNKYLDFRHKQVMND